MCWCVGSAGVPGPLQEPTPRRPHRGMEEGARLVSGGLGGSGGKSPRAWKGGVSRRVKGSGLRLAKGRPGRAMGREPGGVEGGGGGDLSRPMMASMVKAGLGGGRVIGGEEGAAITGLTGVGATTPPMGGRGVPAV